MRLAEDIRLAVLADGANLADVEALERALGIACDASDRLPVGFRVRLIVEYTPAPPPVPGKRAGRPRRFPTGG